MGTDYPVHRLAREPAPAHLGEGPFALWHYSENPGLGHFRPRPPVINPQRQPPLVWAVDTRHAPTFWFPRDCPRGCIWPVSTTTAEDRERFFGQSGAGPGGVAVGQSGAGQSDFGQSGAGVGQSGAGPGGVGRNGASRVHVIESGWLRRMRDCTLYAYRLPVEPFRPDQVGGYWVADVPVDAIERIIVDDLLDRHAQAGIELRITPSIWPFWQRVVNSTVEFSGSRLRNSAPHPDRFD